MYDLNLATSLSLSITIVSFSTMFVSLLMMSILYFSSLSSFTSAELSLHFYQFEDNCPLCFHSKLGFGTLLETAGLSLFVSSFTSDYLRLVISLTSITTSSPGIDWEPPLFLNAADAGGGGFVSYFGDLNLLRSSLRMS